MRGSYPEQQFISLGIEAIVGRQKMESMYFNADLEGLVKELSKYASLNEVHELLKEIDACHKNDGKNDQFYKAEAAKARVMIANIKNRNDERLYQEGKLTDEEYNFRKFRSYCYIKGYRFIKKGNDFGIENRYDTEGKILTADGYRIVMNNFLNSDVSRRELTIGDSNNENGDLVDMCFCLNSVHFRDGHDLSAVANIELLPQGYRLIFKENEEVIGQNDHNELDMMFSENSVKFSTNNFPNIKKYN